MDAEDEARFQVKELESKNQKRGVGVRESEAEGTTGCLLQPTASGSPPAPPPAAAVRTYYIISSASFRAEADSALLHLPLEPQFVTLTNTLFFYPPCFVFLFTELPSRPPSAASFRWVCQINWRGAELQYERLWFSRCLKTPVRRACVQMCLWCCPSTYLEACYILHDSDITPLQLFECLNSCVRAGPGSPTWSSHVISGCGHISDVR